MSRTYRIRLAVTGLVIAAAMLLPGLLSSPIEPSFTGMQEHSEMARTALRQLDELPVKGRAPKTGYTRAQFGDGWADVGSCDTRNVILARDLHEPDVTADCLVLAGTLDDPYTGEKIQFERGVSTSALVQIDHVVSLSDAWQKGAQELSYQRRVVFANDPLNLLAVDGKANQTKSDGDAATWLPPHKPFRCQYVTRQVKVKTRYHLWVTGAEKQAINRVLLAC